MLFQDRRDAGRQLARKLSAYKDRENTIVLGLPRGGVPVAYEVALALNLPLDVFIVRKLGAPGREELAMGAIASGGARILNADVLAQMMDADAALAEASARESMELDRREFTYRGNHPPLDLTGSTVILVDDGLATGATMRAGAAAIRQLGARWVVAALPVGALSSCDVLRQEVDELVVVQTPEDFQAVGQYYADFGQTTDDEVRKLLARAQQELSTDR